MKKFVLSVLTQAVVGCLTSCSFMSGVDAPENFRVHAVGRAVTFTWDEVSGADHYAIEISGGGQKWEDEEVSGAILVVNNMTNLLNWTEYSFRVCAVNSMGIKGPASDSQTLYMPYAFENRWSLTYANDQEVYSKSTDKNVTISWENIKTSSHIGCPGIEYRVYRLEGTRNVGFFKEVEGNAPVLVADHIKHDIQFQGIRYAN